MTKFRYDAKCREPNVTAPGSRPHLVTEQLNHRSDLIPRG